MELPRESEKFKKFFKGPIKETFKELINDHGGEQDYLDFKEKWISYPKLARHILAFANTEGGVIIFGIDDDGKKKGIEEPKDPKKVDDQLSQYFCSGLGWKLYDFDFTDEQSELKGKIFQALLIGHDPKLIPFLCKKDGFNEHDKKNFEVKKYGIYVRKGTSSRIAEYTELQEIINKRIETGYSSKGILDLNEHLQQLKALYENKNSHLISFGIVDKLHVYDKFVSSSIKKKEQIINDIISRT